MALASWLRSGSARLRGTLGTAASWMTDSAPAQAVYDDKVVYEFLVAQVTAEVAPDDDPGTAGDHNLHARSLRQVPVQQGTRPRGVHPHPQRRP